MLNIFVDVVLNTHKALASHARHTRHTQPRWREGGRTRGEGERRKNVADSWRCDPGEMRPVPLVLHCQLETPLDRGTAEPDNCLCKFAERLSQRRLPSKVQMCQGFNASYVLGPSGESSCRLSCRPCFVLVLRKLRLQRV